MAWTRDIDSTCRWPGPPRYCSGARTTSLAAPRRDVATVSAPRPRILESDIGGAPRRRIGARGAQIWRFPCAVLPSHRHGHMPHHMLCSAVACPAACAVHPCYPSRTFTEIEGCSLQCKYNNFWHTRTRSPGRSQRDEQAGPKRASTERASMERARSMFPQANAHALQPLPTASP